MRRLKICSFVAALAVGLFSAPLAQAQTVTVVDPNCKGNCPLKQPVNAVVTYSSPVVYSTPVNNAPVVTTPVTEPQHLVYTSSTPSVVVSSETPATCTNPATCAKAGVVVSSGSYTTPSNYHPSAPTCSGTPTPVSQCSGTVVSCSGKKWGRRCR